MLSCAAFCWGKRWGSQPSAMKSDFFFNAITSVHGEVWFRLMPLFFLAIRSNTGDQRLRFGTTLLGYRYFPRSMPGVG